MGRNADLDACAADGRDIGRIEIALAEMDEIAAELDRRAPIIVDDKLRAGGVAQRRAPFGSRAEYPPPAGP